MGSRRKFTREFKLDAVQRLRAGEPAGLVARSLEVSRQELYRWSRDVDKFGERAFPGVGQKRAEETRIAELERVFHRDTAADTMSAIRHAAGENADPLPTLDNTMAVRDTVARLIADVYGGKVHPRIAAGLAPLTKRVNSATLIAKSWLSDS
jgi:transposase